MRQECRERFPRHHGFAISIGHYFCWIMLIVQKKSHSGKHGHVIQDEGVIIQDEGVIVTKKDFNDLCHCSEMKICYVSRNN